MDKIELARMIFHKMIENGYEEDIIVKQSKIIDEFISEEMLRQSSDNSIAVNQKNDI